MKPITTLAAAAASYVTIAAAALCTPGGLLGIGDSVKTFPPDYQFILFARNTSGYLLGVTSTNSGDYAPVTLGDASQSLFGFPEFEVVNGNLRTYNQPYRYVTTKSDPLIAPTQLFTSPDGVGRRISIVANNVTCDGVSANAVRYQGLLPLSTGSGTVNGSFAAGSTLSSPILDPILPITVLKPIDMTLKFF